MKNATTFALIAAALVAIAAAYAAIYFLTPQGGRYDSLARCLTANGAIMYGSAGCQACQYQMSLLGESFKYISEVDCIQQYQVCMNQQIGATPTWLINGTLVAGVQTPGQLANLSGCGI